MPKKAKYGSVKVIDRSGKLYLDFRYSSNRLRPSLNLVANAQNMKAAQLIASKIELDIAMGQFDPTLAKYIASSKPAPATPKPSQLTPYDVHVNWMLEHGKSGNYYESVKRFLKRYSPTWKQLESTIANQQWGVTTFNRSVAVMNDSFSWGHKIYGTPEIFVPRRKGSKQQHAERKPFNSDEIKLLVDAFATDRFTPKCSRVKHSYYLPYVKALLITGCRPGELVGLKVKHVDLTNKTLEISESLSKESNYSTKRVQKPTKTGSVRYLPIPNSLLDCFSELVKGKGNEDYVFTGPEGKPIDHSNFSQRIWKPVMNGLGIPYRVPYASRHTMISVGIEQGIPLTGLAYLAGHADTAMIQKHYGHMINRPNLPEINLGAA